MMKLQQTLNTDEKTDFYQPSRRSRSLWFSNPDDNAENKKVLTAVDVLIPPSDDLVRFHHDNARLEIELLSPSRAYGADTNLKSWRRSLTAVKLAGTNGYAFEGQSLTPGVSASLPVGSIVVAVDSSWARAKWYARHYIKPLEQKAMLLRVAEDGALEALVESIKKSWARDLIGYIASNREMCKAACVCLK